MKNLRGRPPRIISGSGILYLDSDDEEDSDYTSDSEEVGPVIFPGADFDDDEDGYDVPGFVNILNAAAHDTDDSSSEDEGPPIPFPPYLAIQAAAQALQGQGDDSSDSVELNNRDENPGRINWRLYFPNRAPAVGRQIVNDNANAAQLQQEEGSNNTNSSNINPRVEASSGTGSVSVSPSSGSSSEPGTSRSSWLAQRERSQGGGPGSGPFVGLQGLPPIPTIQETGYIIRAQPRSDGSSSSSQVQQGEVSGGRNRMSDSRSAEASPSSTSSNPNSFPLEESSNHSQTEKSTAASAATTTIESHSKIETSGKSEEEGEAPAQIQADANSNSSLPKESEHSKPSPSFSPVVEDNSCSSSLVPYPDLPDYASGGEEEDNLDRVKTRHSLKRKEPEESSDDEGPDDRGNRRQNQVDKEKTLENKKKAWKVTVDMEEDASSTPATPELSNNEAEEEEVTCNPMVSDTEELEEADDAFRGDRIGNTVYSERHVLKILMMWVENLPQYSVDKLLDAKEKEESEEVIEKTILRLETKFEEQMTLLWDMSAETDVMNFLVENKIFSFIRDTVDRSACGRLTEIALGILANVISEPSVIDDFTVHDASLGLVQRAVELCSKVSDVSVLIQVFSVLRRVVWYVRNVAYVKTWTDLLTSADFLESANFIMRSSTNALLLGNVIVLFFALIECLNTENETEEEENENGSESREEHRSDSDPNEHLKSESEQTKVEKDRRLEALSKNYEPFCKDELQFVPSLCEGVKELMKDPKPRNTRKNLTSTREKPSGPGSSSGCQTDDHCPNADEIDVPIPEGHVQQAILKGFSTLALLQKSPNGQEALKRHAPQVISVVLDFYRIFVLCTEAVTRSDSLEYFTLSLHLLSFCHVSLSSVNSDAIISPVTTASKLVSQEEKDKEMDTPIKVQLKGGVEFDSVSYIALVTHEYLAAVAEKFGPDAPLKVRNNSSYTKLFRVIDQVLSKCTEEDGEKQVGGREVEGDVSDNDNAVGGKWEEKE